MGTTSDPASTTAASTTSEKPATTSENPATTSEEPATTSEEPATTSEEPATTSNVPVTTSEDPSTTTAIFDAVCPDNEDGFLDFVPHPFDCTKYYECAWGVPILMDCAPPLFFDPNLNICNWPDLVDCEQPNPINRFKRETFQNTTSDPASTTAASTTSE